MRLLHTADWHLGQRFHDQRRAEDEEHALGLIVNLARERQVDAILVAGDIFDTANPGAEEHQRYFRFLNRARVEAGVASIVVIGGNHDSALRLDGPRSLLETLGIHVVGRWPRESSPDRCLVELRNRRGEIAALCLAIPFLRDADLRLPEAGEKSTEIHDRYRAALEARYGEAHAFLAEKGPEDQPRPPLLVMGHCFAAGGEAGGGERRVQVGNLAQARAASLAGEAAYLALGHLHRPQRLGGKDMWRYSGSLLPTGFDEISRRREVVLVDLEADGSTSIERLDLEPYREYRRLSGSASEVFEAIEALPQAEPDQATPWCEARVRLDGPRPGLARELVERAKERGWNLVSVRREALGGLSDEASPSPTRDLRELDPVDVFAELHRQTFDRDPDQDLQLAFVELLTTVQHADSEERQSAESTQPESTQPSTP